MLSDEQLEKLSERLIGTRANIYTLCQTMFGVKANDTTFDQLERKCSIFRCDECSTWMDVRNKVDGMDLCKECKSGEECD